MDFGHIEGLGGEVNGGLLYEKLPARSSRLFMDAYGVIVRPLSKSHILRFHTTFRIRDGAVSRSVIDYDLAYLRLDASVPADR